MVFEPKTWYIAFQNCHLTHCITDSNVNKNRTAGGFCGRHHCHHNCRYVYPKYYKHYDKHHKHHKKKYKRWRKEQKKYYKHREKYYKKHGKRHHHHHDDDD